MMSARQHLRLGFAWCGRGAAAAAWWCAAASVVVAALWGALPASGQSDAEVDAWQQQVADQMKVIEQQLQDAGRQIESEQQALLGKLGRTHDELMAERQRSAALDAKVRALLGESAAGGAGTGTTGPGMGSGAPAAGGVVGGVAWVELPRRRVGPLGLIEATDAVLAALPAGTDEVVLNMPSGLTPPEGAALPRLESAGLTVRLVYPGVLGEGRPVATLSGEGGEGGVGGELMWRWHAISPTDMDRSLRFLDGVLRLSVIEARRAGVVLRRYQPAPVEVRVATDTAVRSLPLPVPTGVGGVRLEPESVPAGWAVLLSQPARVDYVSVDRYVSLRWNGDNGTVTVRTGPGLHGRLDAVRRERQGWERDLATASSGGAAAAGMDVARITARLEALRESEEKLEAALASLRPPSSAGLSAAPVGSTASTAPATATASAVLAASVLPAGGIDSLTDSDAGFVVTRLVAAQRGVVLLRLRFD